MAQLHTCNMIYKEWTYGASRLVSGNFWSVYSLIEGLSLETQQKPSLETWMTTCISLLSCSLFILLTWPSYQTPKGRPLSLKLCLVSGEFLKAQSFFVFFKASWPPEIQQSLQSSWFKQSTVKTKWNFWTELRPHSFCECTNLHCSLFKGNTSAHKNALCPFGDTKLFTLRIQARMPSTHAELLSFKHTFCHHFVKVGQF